MFKPLPYVKTMYYLNVDLYRYFIGREDQSVNEKIMIGRIDQQIKVTKIMIDSFEQAKIKSKRLQKYMIQYLTMMMTVSTVLLLKSNTEENLNKKDELWNYLRSKNKNLYEEVNKTFLGKLMQMNTSFGKKIILSGYSLSRKIYAFN